MRICEKCGHVDHPMWRPNAWNPQYDYAPLESIEWNDEELWQLIKDKKTGEVIQRGVFVYWKTEGGSNTVRRCWIEDFKIVGKKGDPQERVDHSLLALITPLDEFLYGHGHGEVEEITTKEET